MSTATVSTQPTFGHVYMDEVSNLPIDEQIVVKDLSAKLKKLLQKKLKESGETLVLPAVGPGSPADILTSSTKLSAAELANVDRAVRDLERSGLLLYYLDGTVTFG